MNCNVSYVINFSPDGTALATASADGQVKFFQVYMHGTENPRCLHQWKPHDGQPVSTLFFLDNHKDHQPDEQFWKVRPCEKKPDLKELKFIYFSPRRPQFGFFKVFFFSSSLRWLVVAKIRSWSYGLARIGPVYKQFKLNQLEWLMENPWLWRLY